MVHQGCNSVTEDALVRSWVYLPAPKTYIQGGFSYIPSHRMIIKVTLKLKISVA